MEDDPADAELTRSCLWEVIGAGGEILHAKSLTEAFGVLRLRGVDLVLLDLDLPDSAGLITLERLRSATGCPIVLVTGNDHPDLHSEAIKRRADAVLLKSRLGAKSLMQLVTDATGGRRRLRPDLLDDAAELEQRFRATFEKAAVGLAHVAVDGRFQLVNETLCRLLGYSREELLQRTVRDISHPEDVDVTNAQRAALHAGERSGFSAAKRYLCKDGSTRWMELAVSAMRDATGAPSYDIAVFQDISERRRAEQALQVSERRFRATFDQAAVGIAHLDMNDRFRLVNDRLCEILGYERAELLGQPISAFSHPDQAQSTREHRRRIAAGEIRHASVEKRYLRKGGTPVWVRLTVSLARDDGGAPAYYIVVLEDISERHRAKLHLNRMAELYSAISLTNEAILRAESPEEMFSAACDIAVQSGGFALCAVALLDPQTLRLKSAAASGPGAALMDGLVLSADASQPGGRGMMGHAARTGEARISNDFRADVESARWVEEHLGFPIGSACAFPLRCDGEVVGAFGLLHGDRGAFDEDTAALMWRLADNVSFALEGFRREARRLKAEENLRRFRAALDVAPDMIFLVDTASMRLTDVNDAACRSLGYQRDELIGQSPTSLLVGASEEELRAGYEMLIANDSGAEPMRARYRRSDGSLIPVEITRRVLRTPDGVYVVGLARDLTEQLKGEERLRHSIERFESVSRATNDVVRDWNLRTDEIWWNGNFEAVFGWPPREVGAYVDSWVSRIHAEDREEVVNSVNAAVAAGHGSWSGRYRFERRDGSYAVVEDRGLVLRDERGTPARMIGSMIDVTARVLAEEQLAAHARRHEAVARLGQMALDHADLQALFAEAVRVLKESGADAAVLAEGGPEPGEFVVCAGVGEGCEQFIGDVATAASDSCWRRVLEGESQVISDRDYFLARPADRPRTQWLRRMGSAVYAPLRGDAAPLGVLAMYSLREHAFRDEDLRFAEAIGNVVSTAVQSRAAQTRLEYLAQFDALTGLPNRNLLHDRLQQTIVQSRRSERSGAVLFIDLDRFKLVNDTLGHQLGDELIAQAGKRLQDCVRPGDTVGRVSGDEFAVVLAELAHPDDASLIAQKMLEALARPFPLGGSEAYVTASIGITTFPEDGGEAENLLRNADLAMYRAKESTRNAYCFFDAEMNRRSAARLQLNTDLRRAIERREFTLHYQPKVELSSGTMIGVEALLRWSHPQRGMVSPAEFIPALEESGQILAVGEWVLQEACAQIRRWQELGLEPVPVAVNLSAKQFQRADLDVTVRGTLAASGVPADLLELEVTESCLVEKPGEAVRLLESLRAAGVKISVDDFGTGYSSLSYLTRLPLSALKIDRSFVRDAQTSSEAASIVRAVIDMAHNLGFTVVAEGVETAQQVAFLRSHGCDLGQGFLFARPMPAEELAGRLRSR
ncbi:MAG: PAS domain S-box protein [Burkholderiales bacterium]